MRWWGMSLGPGSRGDRGHVECGESSEEGERMWVAAGLEVVGCLVCYLILCRLVWGMSMGMVNPC